MFRFNLRKWWRLRFGWQWFRGDYASWAEARAVCGGYDNAAIMTRVLAATRAVRDGRAVYERDGVAFTDRAVNARLVAELRRAAEDTGGRLTVVDFGGSLGSTWWQHRAVLADLPEVRWRVVEQSHYVAAGEEFADEQLTFHDTIDAATRAGERPVILLSSVLPYLESPMRLLDEIVRCGFRVVIIDRTPLVRSGRTRLTVQHTPPGLGGGRYPCWLLERELLFSVLRENYIVVREWPALDELASDVVHRGFYFRRKDA